MERTESGERGVVLVVDDDAAARQALCELLSARFDAHGAGDGEQALELARKLRPSLILLDVFLPQLDGMAAYTALRQDARTRGIPVIFISGQREDLPARCLELGGADFVSKPVQPRELMARIDRTLRERKERSELEELAQTDGLTGLANFRALRNHFDQEYRRAVRYHYPISVVMLDLDHLKQINDRYGHEVGNQAILAVANHLKQSLRETDFAARFGGDEFCVLLPYQTPAEANVFVERLRTTLPRLTLPGADLELSLSLSCGVASHYADAPKEDEDALLRAADQALYEAKRRGRNRAIVYELELAMLGEDQQLG